MVRLSDVRTSITTLLSVALRRLYNGCETGKTACYVDRLLPV